jgi:predicted enzyme related to lactoylglutathione lyase
MAYPNTLIFVDFPSTDPEASAEFYSAVFGW